MDLSGLGTFNATIANLYVGRPTSVAGAAANGRPLTDSLALAGANTVTASGVIAVGGTTNSFGFEQATMNLGTTNTLNAASFVIGSSRTNGTIQFNTGLTSPGVTLRGAAGGVTRTDIYLGDGGNVIGVSNNAGGSTGILGKMDFTGGSVDAMIENLIVGMGGGTASNNRANGQGNFIIDGASSNVDVNTLVIAQDRNDGSATSSTVTATASTGTLTMINGTLVVNTAATLANDIDVSNTANSKQGLNATFNLQGGTATIGSLGSPVNLILGNHVASGNAGAATATVTLTGGTLNVFGDINEGNLGNGTITSSLTLDGATLDMKGHSIGLSGALVDTLTFSSGTLKNVAEINNGGTLTKSGGGTLTLSGTNTYTGDTIVSVGTLALVGGSHASAISVSAIASLGFTLGTPTSSSSTVDLTAGSVTITGTVDNSSDYKLMTATSFTGVNPAAASVTDYELQLQNGGTELWLVYTGGGATPYETWATGSEPFDGDANGDGVKDGLAFLLGAANPSENAISRLPTVTESGSGLVMTFNCLPVAARGTATLKVSHSNTLTSWTPTLNVVPDATNPTADNNVTFVVGAGPSGPPALNTVTATIDPAAAAAGKLFGRLEAEQP